MKNFDSKRIAHYICQICDLFSIQKRRSAPTHVNGIGEHSCKKIDSFRNLGLQGIQIAPVLYSAINLRIEIAIEAKRGTERQMDIDARHDSALPQEQIRTAKFDF
jgi:hypothetical protein